MQGQLGPATVARTPCCPLLHPQGSQRQPAAPQRTWRKNQMLPDCTLARVSTLTPLHVVGKSENPMPAQTLNVKIRVKIRTDDTWGLARQAARWSQTGPS